MIDVNKITSTLAKLPDQQLQQYAQMHKNDPYIMALAMSESNRRKEMRAASQGGQGMQEQPKVVDQMLAEMAPQQMPEDQGIGQLPAGEMNFAGGGIIAFADGGDVERYQSQGLVQPRARWEEELERLQAPPQESSALGRGIVGAFTYSSDFESLLQSAKAKQASGIPLTAPEARALQSEEAPTATKKESPFEQERARNMARVANEGYTRGDPRALPTMPSGKEQLSSVAAPKVDTGRRAKPTADTASASAKLPSMSDLTTLYQDILGKQNFQDPAAEASLQLEAQERANAAADRQAIARDAERFKDAYKGREDRLAEREADIGKQKGANTGLAFLNAGLAIMSTPGGLATAIGKGAQVGTAQFAAGLDKIRSAQERLGEARDRLDDLKLNREEVTAKDLRDAERRYRDVAVNAQKRTIDGVRQAAGVNEARAKNIYDKTVDMTKTMYEQGEATKRSAVGNRNNQLEMLKALQADPKLMATYRTMQGKNEDVMGQYTDFLKANPALAMDPKAAFTQFLMTKSAFQQLGASPVTEKAAGPVRKQP
jgi:hypothetical protein